MSPPTDPSSLTPSTITPEPTVSTSDKPDVSILTDRSVAAATNVPPPAVNLISPPSTGPSTKAAPPETLPDPKGWTSNPKALMAEVKWGNTNESWAKVIQKNYGLVGIVPLLFNQTDSFTYLVSAGEPKEKKDFYLFNEVTGNVYHVVKPVEQEKIWEALSTESNDFQTEMVPVNMA